ncbi:MAG: hypothetical protein WBD01_01525 [Salaquimonas sp.]
MVEESEQSLELTEEASLVIALSRDLFAKDVDAVFRKLGEHMDRHGLKISETAFAEFRQTGRIK